MEIPAINHHGYPGSAFRLLLRRVQTRFSLGMGETFRAAIGRPHFWFIVRNDRKLVLALLVAVWWSFIVITPFALAALPAALALGAIFLFPFCIMSVRWRSIHHGLYCLAAWNAFTLSFLPGLMRSRVSPTRWIESTVVKTYVLAYSSVSGVSDDAGRGPPPMADRFCQPPV
jgi:hypothetical protein